MKKIAFILYPGITALDLIGAYDPLSRLKSHGALTDLEWDFCALQSEIRDTFGLLISPTKIGKPLNGYDLVIIPGGQGSRSAMQDPALIQWIQGVSSSSVVASVCTGALILAAAGFLEGKRAATHPSARSQLEKMGNITLVADRVVEDGRIITSGGVTAGIDLGLYLVEKYSSPENTRLIREEMDYLYQPPGLFKKNRSSHIHRETRETKITVDLNLDGSGQHTISTGLPFFDHMLSQIAVHGLFDLNIQAIGDLQVDPHHTIEDVGLCLGSAFYEALGEKRGVNRMSSAFCPMDDSLAQVVVDFSGRPYSNVQIHWVSQEIGGIPVSLFPHFFESLAYQARCNLHIQVPYGKDDHHQIEAVFKALARAFYSASRIDPNRAGQVPSSKGKI
jgi:imidazoleglycerol-phosphate dehydratase